MHCRIKFTGTCIKILPGKVYPALQILQLYIKLFLIVVNIKMREIFSFLCRPAPVVISDAIHKKLDGEALFGIYRGLPPKQKDRYTPIERAAHMPAACVDRDRQGHHRSTPSVCLTAEPNQLFEVPADSRGCSRKAAGGHWRTHPVREHRYWRPLCRPGASREDGGA